MRKRQRQPSRTQEPCSFIPPLEALIRLDQKRTVNSAPFLGHAAESALHESCNNLLRHWCRLQLVGVIRMAADQYAGLESLDRQRLALEHLVRHLKTRPL